MAKKPNTLLHFFIIWAGQAISLAGSSVRTFALIWWLTQLTGSATVLATASIAGLLPRVVLGPLAGAYVDRWNRRTVMLVSDGAVALASLGLAYLYWLDTVQIWHVYGLLLINALGAAFQWPAMQASTSLMVPEKHLARVAGFNQTLEGILNIVGPPLGALALTALSMTAIMLIDVGTALFAVLPLFVIAIPQPESRAAAQGEAAQKPSIWFDVREGLRYVWHFPGLVLVLAMAMIINVTLHPALALTPILITDVFQGGAIQLSWLESSWGVGIVLGGLTLGLWGGFQRKIITALVGIICAGVGFLIMGLAGAPHLWIAIGGMFVVGFMLPMANGPFFALLQATVKPEMQGRVFTIALSMSAGIAPLGLAVAGPMADLIGVRSWYLLSGLVCVLVGLAAFFIPAVMNLEAQAPAQEEADAAEPVDMPPVTSP